MASLQRRRDHGRPGRRRRSNDHARRANARGLHVGGRGRGALHVRSRPAHVEILDADGRRSGRADPRHRADADGVDRGRRTGYIACGAHACERQTAMSDINSSGDDLRPRAEPGCIRGHRRRPRPADERLGRPGVPRAGPRRRHRRDPGRGVEFGGGFGFGGDNEANGGGGGGGWNDGRPVAIIEAGPEACGSGPSSTSPASGSRWLPPRSRCGARSTLPLELVEQEHLGADQAPPVGEVQALVLAVDVRLCGIVGPISSAGMPPNASANGPTNGIDPPTPISTGSTPKPGVQRALGGVERGAGRIGLPRGRAFERAERAARAPTGPRRSTCAAQAGEHACRDPGPDPSRMRDARRCARDDLVRRALDRDGRRSR